MENYLYNKFNNISSFIKSFENSSYELKSSNKKKGSSWCDTYDLEEAINNTKYGKNKKIHLNLFAKFNKDFSKFENKLRFKKDIVGQQPIVASYIQGNPRSMFRKIKQEIRKKILNILIIGGMNCGGSSSQIINNAINNFKIVKIFESKGYKCNLRLLFVSEHVSLNQSFQVDDIQLKNADERFNLSKMVNPLCSSSFFRRLWFRFVEVKHEDKLSYGYGRSSDTYEILRHLKTLNIKYDYILPNAENQKLSINDEMLINDFDKTLQNYCLK